MELIHFWLYWLQSRKQLNVSRLLLFKILTNPLLWLRPVDVIKPDKVAAYHQSRCLYLTAMTYNSSSSCRTFGSKWKKFHFDRQPQKDPYKFEIYAF
ncbi:Hypothetical protein NTJ_06293 [Nesidiocoris tenuis]|uniref:Uncharacterized protein n=1 Tax=Nesidiocoris tenuis TaxID=355587 RepID=A0ABN7AN35_9HEMI|nr:Hypothetical protein NTJ_06293 [Nesidiocoris tenuis]